MTISLEYIGSRQRGASPLSRPFAARLQDVSPDFQWPRPYIGSIDTIMHLQQTSLYPLLFPL